MCIPVASLAQEPQPLSVERPSFSSSPLTLAPSTWQLEVGYQLTRDEQSIDTDDHTLPFLLARIGLANRLELQVNWAGISWLEVDGLSSRGGNDASIGVKWQATDRDAPTPIGLFASLSVPVGADALTSDDFDPTIGLFWSHSGKSDLFGTVTISESNTKTIIGNAFGVSFSLANDVGAYIEYFGVFAQGSSPENHLNGGISFLANHDRQFDVYGGAGLNDHAADWFIGFGFAQRF